MTATFRQIQANQMNAAKSTGPKTEEGKAVSSRNAVTHGMTSLEPTSDEQAEFEARLELWRHGSSFGPLVGDHVDREALFQQAVLQTMRIERAQKREFELIDAAKARAITSWQSDRTNEAEKIGATLSKKPGLGVAKLCCFLQGVVWLIQRWEMLQLAIKEQGKATPEQMVTIQDLLGTPLDSRRPFVDGLPAEAALAMIDSKLGPLKQNDLPALKALDNHERTLAETGFQAETSREERLNRRYEDLAYRRFEAARKALLDPKAKRPDVLAERPKPTPTATTAVAPPSQSVPTAKADSPKPQIPSAKPVVPSTSTAPAPNEPNVTMGKMNPIMTPILQQRSA